MAFHLPNLCIFLSLAIVASHAALPSEVYWKSKLPNTPMPKAVKDILYPVWMEDKSTYVGVGKGGVGVNTGKPGGKPTKVGVGKGGVVVSAGPKGNPVYVGVKPGPSPFVYKYAATQDQLKDNPNVALFFLEKDLHQGKQMNLYFFKTTAPTSFLPRAKADSIPFSSERISDVFKKLSVDPNSEEAAAVSKTVKECEEPVVVKGEKKLCATSLESMIDFSTAELGTRVEAVSTEAQKENVDRPERYDITGVRKVTSADNKAIACHKQDYPYAVFYCHKTQSTTAYTVSMVAQDGAKAEAVAVCHEDTSAWNPNHLAFQVLKVKPGSVPICHFLPEDHIVWVPNN